MANTINIAELTPEQLEAIAKQMAEKKAAGKAAKAEAAKKKTKIGKDEFADFKKEAAEDYGSFKSVMRAALPAAAKVLGEKYPEAFFTHWKAWEGTEVKKNNKDLYTLHAACMAIKARLQSGEYPRVKADEDTKPETRPADAAQANEAAQMQQAA